MTHMRNSYVAGSTVYIPFATFDANGASVTMTGFALGDIRVYKNGSITQRSSTAGITLLDTDGTDFDGVTGLHGFSINLNDNTDAGFYAAGSEYWVVVTSVTVAGQTVSFIADRFRITTTDQSTSVVQTGDAYARLGAPAGASIAADIAAVQSDTDNVQTRIPAALVGGRMDASVGAMAANVMTAAAAAADLTTELQTGLATSASIATLQADTDDIQARLPAALVGGKIDASIGALAAGAISRATFAADTGLQSIRSNTAQAGAGSTMTLDAAASAVNDYYKDAIIYITGGTGVGQFRTVTGYVGSSKVATVSPVWSTNPDATSTFAIVLAGLSGLASASDIANAIWDAAIAAHLAAGSTGLALNSAAASGDPWTAPLPGTYPAGTAGNLIGNRLDVAVGTRLAPTVANRTLDVTTGGEAGIDWGNIGTPGATVNLANTTVDIVDLVNNLGAGAITGISIASNALVGKGDWNIGKSGYDLSIPGIQAIWDSLTTDLTTAGSIGKRLADFITGDAYVRLGAPIGASISADLATKAATGAAMTLTAGERIAVADAMLDEVNGVETGQTVRQTLRGLTAMNFGVAQDAQSGLETFKNPSGANTRLVIADDAQGNRTSVTRTL